MPSGPDVLSQAGLKARIDTELRTFVGAEADLLEAVDPLPAPVGAQLRAAVADGKRVRAAFCYWGGAEAYLYAWQVVGAMLGIDIQAAPADLAEARDFSDLYMTKFMGPSEEGVLLTRQLIELYEEVVPGTLLDPVVPALIRYLVGDTAADWLRVPRSALFDHLVPAAPLLLGLTEHLKERSPLAAIIIDRLGAVTTRFELSSLTRGRIMHYAIPDHLKDEYGVRRPKAERWTPPPVSALVAEPRAGA